jgi:hypothetical protein
MLISVFTPKTSVSKQAGQSRMFAFGKLAVCRG